MDISYIIAGVLSGLVIGVTGVGGGALITPILLLFLGVPTANAIPTDLCFAAITKVFGALFYQKVKLVDWRVAGGLWACSLPISILVAILISLDIVVVKIIWMNKVIGALFIISAVCMVASPWLSVLIGDSQNSRTQKFRNKPALTIIVGVILGFCVTFTSIGAGALGAIALLYLYSSQMSVHRLVGTDIVHAIPLAATCGFAYWILGRVDVLILSNLLIRSTPAIIAGALIANKLPVRSIQLILSFTLCLAGIKLLI
jgi:uncharacterized membrane protein YfcA